MDDEVLTIAALTLASVFLNVATSRSTMNPGIDSSLSNVPPVCPRPPSDIIGTMAPSEATIGARMRLGLIANPACRVLIDLGAG